MNLLKLKLQFVDCKKEDLEFLQECNRDLEEEIRFEALKLQKKLIEKYEGIF